MKLDIEKKLSRNEALQFLKNINGSEEKIEEWDYYRKRNPDWIPDLSDSQNPANLRNIKICHKDSNGIWKGVNLEGSILFAADLTSADLHNVNLKNSNLSHATLDNAELKYSNLENANLRDAR